MRIPAKLTHSVFRYSIRQSTAMAAPSTNHDRLPDPRPARSTFIYRSPIRDVAASARVGLIGEVFVFSFPPTQGRAPSTAILKILEPPSCPDRIKWTRNPSTRATTTPNQSCEGYLIRRTDRIDGRRHALPTFGAVRRLAQLLEGQSISLSPTRAAHDRSLQNHFKGTHSSMRNGSRVFLMEKRPRAVRNAKH